MKKIILFCILHFAFYIPLAEASGDDGGLPGYFLNQGAGARALAMGRAYVAEANDPTSVYWNPASLSDIKKRGLSAMHVLLFEGTAYDFVGYNHWGYGKWNFGLGFISLNTGEIEKRDSSGVADGTFSDTNSALFIGGGYRINSGFSCGLTLKTVQKKFDDISSTGFGLDLGAKYRLRGICTVGLNLQNLVGAKIKRDNATDTLPMNIKVGIGRKLLKDTLTLTLDIDKTADRSLKLHGGAEKIFFDKVSLRAGYDQGSIVGGAGFLLGSMQIDYGILTHELGLSHRISMTLIGGTKEEVQKKKGRKAKEKAEKKVRRTSEVTALIESVEARIKEAESAGANVAAAVESLTQARANLENKRFNAAESKIEFATKEVEDAIRQLSQEVKERKPSRVAKRKPEERLNIAVAELTGKNVSAMDAAIVSDFIRTEMVQLQVFNVVDRQNMERILEEQSFQLSGCTTEECAVQLGKLLNVRYMAVGTFSKFLETYYVNVNVIDVESGKIIAAKAVECSSGKELPGAAKQIADAIAEQLQ